MKDIVDTGQYVAEATWQGTNECVLLRCKELTDFMLHIRAVPEGTAVCRLQGIVAARIFCLLERKRRADLEDREFNCFRTVDFTIGRNRRKTPIQEPKTDVALQEAAAQYGYPMRFELWGTYDTPGEIGGYWETCDGIIHEGLILGEDPNKKYIAFDKPGLLPVRIAQWNEVLEGYPETRSIGFFPINRTGDTSESSSVDHL